LKGESRAKIIFALVRKSFFVEVLARGKRWLFFSGREKTEEK